MSLLNRIVKENALYFDIGGYSLSEVLILADIRICLGIEDLTEEKEIPDIISTLCEINNLLKPTYVNTESPAFDNTLLQSKVTTLEQLKRVGTGRLKYYKEHYIELHDHVSDYLLKAELEEVA